MILGPGLMVMMVVMMVMRNMMMMVVVGDSQCGKTQLINRFANGAFDQVNMSMLVMMMLMVVWNMVLMVARLT